jgi:adenosylhomocysteine nucleosidase
MKILIVYALKPEASSLIHSFAMKSDATDSGLYRSDDVCAVITGIGYERALAACSNAIEIIKPDYIINAGSAGSLSDAVHKKKIYHIGQVLAENAVPIDVTSCGRHEKPIRLFTAVKPLLDDAERKKYSASADCADMEGYAIARSAENAHIPCSIIKIISDAYGDNDSKAIRRSILELSGALNAYIGGAVIPYMRAHS